MGLLEGISNSFRKYQYRKMIHGIALDIRRIENRNTEIVKYKLGVYKTFSPEEFGKLKASIEWQISHFEKLNELSYITKDITKEEDMTPLTKRLREEIIKGRKLIESLLQSYKEQANILRSFDSSGQKREKLRYFIKRN